MAHTNRIVQVPDLRRRYSNTDSNTDTDADSNTDTYADSNTDTYSVPNAGARAECAKQSERDSGLYESSKSVVG